MTLRKESSEATKWASQQVENPLRLLLFWPTVE